MISSRKTRLKVAIADIIISESLPFNISQKPRFKKVSDLSRHLSKGYNLPDRKLTSKDLLDVIHDQNMKRNLTMIKKESYVLGYYSV